MITIRSSCRLVGTRATHNSNKDIFGTLSQSGSKALDLRFFENNYRDDPDGYDKEEIDLTPRKNAYFYKYEISKYARMGKVGIKRALELFHQMKSKDRLKPEVGNFSALIYGCANAGYTQKAFELFQEYKKYNDKPTSSIVTCLINACAESPFREYGIKRLDWFLDHMKSNYNYKFCLIHYNAAIKAYGRLGSQDSQSKLIQEMITNKIKPDLITMNSLLIGCASHKENGSLWALRIFRKIKLLAIRPDIYTYRLLLRCIRDCGMGSPELFKLVLQEFHDWSVAGAKSKDQSILSTQITDKKPKLVDFEWFPSVERLESSKAKTSLDNKSSKKGSKHYNPEELLDISSALTISEKTNSVSPILSSPSEQRGELSLLTVNLVDFINQIEAVNFEKLTSPIHRVALFGGVRGLLNQMIKDKCKPDDKVFCFMIYFFRADFVSSLELYRLIREYSVTPTLAYYGTLFKYLGENFKVVNRMGALKYYMTEMQKDNVLPDIRVLNSLALACSNSRTASKLISDLKRSGFDVNDVMIKNFFNSAMASMDFEFLNMLIEYCKKEKSRPTKDLVEKLESLRIESYSEILKYERGELNNQTEGFDEDQIKLFDKFSSLLHEWLSLVKVKDEEHPWDQFYVDSTSRRAGYKQFVRYFQDLEEAKKDVMNRGKLSGPLIEKNGGV